jgi:GntR family transcriptional regulator, transcriptional repressor for pyruvate dehydrogenase complex
MSDLKIRLYRIEVLENKFMASASNKVLNWLIEELIQNDYKNGQCLPGEIELVETLKVSRSSVREAIAVLKAFGLVRSQPGIGLTVISDTCQLELLHLFTKKIVDSDSLHRQKELLCFLEYGAAETIIKNVTNDDISRLRRLITQICLKEDSPISLLEFNKHFHVLLANITSNKYLLALTVLFCDNLLAGNNNTDQIISDHEINDNINVIDALEHHDLNQLQESILKINFR